MQHDSWKKIEYIYVIYKYLLLKLLKPELGIFYKSLSIFRELIGQYYFDVLSGTKPALEHVGCAALSEGNQPCDTKTPHLTQ